MRRSDVLAQVAQCGGLVVANIGFPSRELYALRDRPEHFYMLGSMGMASSIGLGLALTQPRPVFVVDGDGSLLMNLGSLATIAHQAPNHLHLIVVDNGVYGSTGDQPTYAGQRTDLAAMARAAGVRRVVCVDTPAQLCAELERAQVIVARVEPGQVEAPVIPLAPRQIADRFMRVAVPAQPGPES